MATYTTKRCPHCGDAYVLLQHTTTTEYGSPIRTCTRCKKKFIDRDRIEIAIDGIRNIDTCYVSPGYVLRALFFTAITIGSFVALLLYRSSNHELLLCILPAIGCIYYYVTLYAEASTYKDRMRYLEEETKASEARLSNIDYAVFLKNLGYSVPAKYLTNLLENDTKKDEG